MEIDENFHQVEYETDSFCQGGLVCGRTVSLSIHHLRLCERKPIHEFAVHRLSAHLRCEVASSVAGSELTAGQYSQ